MSVLAPPKPPVHEDPEALIEEARRRARRRRLAYIAAAVLVIIIAVAVSALMILTRGGGHTATTVPKGFDLVQARGPVVHGRLVQVGAGWGPQMIDVATGAVSRPGSVYDIWWDRKSGLGRFVVRVAGRVKEDVAGPVCPTAESSGIRCFPPEPFDPGSMRRWPVDLAKGVRRGTFHGRNVIWVKTSNPNRTALDARSHRLFASPQYEHDRLIGYVLYERLKAVPAKSVSFLVPDARAFRSMGFPPGGPSVEHTRRSRLRALHVRRKALLWVGLRFRGKRLGSVETGVTGLKGLNGRLLLPRRFVRLRYGHLQLDEYFGKGPNWYEQGPRPGTVASYGSSAALTKNGVIVLASAPYQFTPKLAVELARALRPFAGG